MLKRWRILVGILLLMLIHVRPTEGQVDSLLSTFQQETDISKMHSIFSQLLLNCNRDSVCLQPFISYLNSAPASQQKVYGILWLANRYFGNDQLDACYRWYNTGMQKAISLDPQHPALSMYYTAYSSVLVFLNKLDSALYYAEQLSYLQRLHQQTSEYWRPAFLQYQIFIELKDFKRADRSIRAAYELVRDSKNRGDKGFILFSLLQALKNRGTEEEFNFFLDEFIRFQKEGQQDPLDSRHMSLLDFFKDDPGAIDRLKKRIAQAEKDSAHFSRDLTYLTLAQLLSDQGKYQEALAQLDLIDITLFPSVTSQKDKYLMQYDIYHRMQEPEKAKAAITRYLDIQDSTYQQILDTRIAEFETKLNIQEKEKKIVETNLALANSHLVQRTFIGLTLLLAIAGMTGILLHRRKLKYQRLMNAKESELQNQRIRELEQKNMLLSLNSLIEGQEAERIRIAQDLHDGLGGLLTTVKAHFNSIQREIENIRNLNVYEKTNQLIDEACMEVRRIAHDMTPYSIKLSGLKGALDDLCQNISTHGPQCELDIHQVNFDQLTEQKANMLYRIIQEITHNAVKHAQASRILIQLIQHQSSLHIMIEDNGRGFDINQVVSNRGMGLKSIDSRVHYLNGKINYDTAPGQGTTVNIEIPLGV